MRTLSKSEIKDLEITIDFTIGKWGTFYSGDGEDFSDELNIYCDWFIKCERIDDCFYTTFICNHINLKNTEGFTDDWLELFNYDVTYKTTIEDIKNNLLNVKGHDVVGGNISNYDFYYAGLMGKKIHEKVKKGKHTKFSELVRVLKKNKLKKVRIY